jgi:HTH-type transcriptional regulator, glycine betaine synthesis regulator
MAVTPINNSDLVQARLLGIETCGRIASFWGFTRTMGRAFGLLYLSTEPLARSEVQTQLRISVGSASMTLSALVRWGVVKKVRRDGERQDLYEAETDFWKMISGILNDRERKEIRAASALIDSACKHAHAAKKQSKGTQRKDAELALARLDQLAAVCSVGETLLDMLLGDLALDIGKFRDVFRPSTQTPPTDP